MPSLEARAQAIADTYQPPSTGRHSDLGDAHALNDFFQAIKDGCPRETAANIAGFGKSPLYRWLKLAEAGDEAASAFRETLEKAEAMAEAEDVRNVRQAGKLPQYWAASMTYLERKYPERWGRRQEADSGPKVIVQIGNPQGDVQILVASSPPSPSLSVDLHSLSASPETD